MATTVDGEGYQIGSNNKIYSGPFMYNHRDGSGWGMNTGSWTQTITTPDWGCPMRSVGTLYCYLPVRNDGGSWGGARARLYYRINSGSWEDCGNSGYSQTDTVMAYNGGGRIDTQTSVFNFDFSDYTSNFTVAFRMDYLTYNGNGGVNSSCDVTTGGDSTYTYNYDASGNRSAVGGNYSVAHMIWLGQGNADIA